MGVDAQMLIGVSREPSPDELQQWGYRLGDAVGPSHLFLSHIGDTFHKIYRAMEIAPMLAENPEEDCTLVDDLTEAEREKSVAFIDVSVCGRYYGPGYERGNLWIYIAVAEWCERNLPGARVYYGGDSGETLELFDAAGRESVIRHWAQHGHIPYSGAIGKWDGEHPLTPTCPLCNVKAHRFGFGQNYASWSCLGCDQGWTWIGGDVVHPKPRHTQSFDHANQLRETVNTK